MTTDSKPTAKPGLNKTDHTIDQSFPASDPPAWSGGITGDVPTEKPAPTQSVKKP